MSCAVVMKGEAPPSSWFTAAELAEMSLPGLPRTKGGVRDLIAREGWNEATDETGAPLARPRRARGGGVEYHLHLALEASARRAASALPAAPLVGSEREALRRRLKVVATLLSAIEEALR